MVSAGVQLSDTQNLRGDGVLVFERILGKRVLRYFGGYWVLGVLVSGDVGVFTGWGWGINLGTEFQIADTHTRMLLG